LLFATISHLYPITAEKVARAAKIKKGPGKITRPLKKFYPSKNKKIESYLE